MGNKSRRNHPKSVLRKSSKLDDETLAAIAYAFCHVVSVDMCAKKVGVSRKRVRDIYLELRDRLAQPRFAQWHRANTILPGLSDPESLALIRTAFFDVLAECAANERCHRNFEAGNRKARICRACPLRGKFATETAITQALELIDLIRNFYRRLKLYGEKADDEVARFRRKLIHTAVMNAALSHTRKSANDLPTKLQVSVLSTHALFEALMVELVERPLVRDSRFQKGAS